MAIINHIRLASIGGWLKDLVLDKTVSYTYARQMKLAEKATKLQTLLTNPGEDEATVPVGPVTLSSDDLTELHEYARPPTVDTDHIWAGAFARTFPFHGLDLPTARVTFSTGDSKDGVKTRFTGDKLHPFLIFVMLSGFPSRVLVVDSQGNPKIDWRQFLKDIIGGWDNPATGPNANTIKRETKKKNWWNRFLLPVKIVIAAVHLAIFIPKLLFNVVKLVTEFLPLVITSYLGKLNGYLAYKTVDNLYSKGILPKLGALFILGPLTVIVAAIHNPFRIISLVGSALTAPETTARDAWTFGNSFKKRPYLGLFVGTIFVLMSIALSTTLWIIAFPVLITLATTHIPALVPYMTSISQLPIVATSLTAIKGGFALAVGSLPAAFTSAAAWLASLVGLSLTAPAVAVGATVAAVGIPTGIIGSRAADELSNSWARWQKGGILQWVFSFFTKIHAMLLGSKRKLKGGEYEPLPNTPDEELGAIGGKKVPSREPSPTVTPESSPGAIRRAEELALANKGADEAGVTSDNKGKTAGKPPEAGSTTTPPPIGGKPATDPRVEDEDDNLVDINSVKGMDGK